MIYNFSPFGYEGSLVGVEVDLRRGIPAVDIVGLSDGVVKESRELVRSAITNSGFEFPPERVLISLSPADFAKKDCDFAIALAILTAGKDTEPILALGHLTASGKVNYIRGLYAGVQTGLEQGIKKFLVPKEQFNEVSDLPGVIPVGTLKEAASLVLDAEEKTMRINKKLLRAIEIAMAGDLHMVVAHNLGNMVSSQIDKLVPLLQRPLTSEEKNEVRRIRSLANLPAEAEVETPFRKPHQQATVEGLYGGGLHCTPGEISLAHNGVLFLDEALEFKTSVLQLLRVPMENRHITLSRAGRFTTFPSDFQLMMATYPCPCGFYGSSEKICLCSAKAVKNYWGKLGTKTLNRIHIKVDIDTTETVEVDVRKLRTRILKTTFTQQKKNKDLTAEEASMYPMTKEAEALLKPFLDYQELRIRQTAITIAQLDDKSVITEEHMAEAIELYKNVKGAQLLELTK